MKPSFIFKVAVSLYERCKMTGYKKYVQLTLNVLLAANLIVALKDTRFGNIQITTK